MADFASCPDRARADTRTNLLRDGRIVIRGVRIHGRMHAQREDFVALTYYNPPGGSHTCLNSKVAACELTLERAGQPPLTLSTQHRAAFEILTDDTHHGVPLAT